MKTINISFKNRSGNNLFGLLDFGDDRLPKDVSAYILIAHCFTCSKNIKAVSHISKSLTEAGLGVFRFDFTGLGDSGGDFSDTNFSTNVNDLIDGALYLENNYLAPSVLIGHSLGGAAVLKAAGKIKSIEAVVTIGAPVEVAHVTEHFKESRDKILKEGEAKVSLVGRDFVFKKQFLEDLETANLIEDIKKLKKPLLIFHSPLDNTVGIENASEIFRYAKHPKSFISLDKADHLLSRKEDSLYVGEIIGAWVGKYLSIISQNKKSLKKESLDSIEDTSSSQVEDKKVKVINEKKDGYRTNLHLRSFHYICDEPLNFGGSNLGATPNDYLLGSLGACTAITLRMYANRKKWDLEKVEVVLEIDNSTGIIFRKLSVSGNLGREEKVRLLEIADKCPVHKTLSREVEIQTSFF